MAALAGSAAFFGLFTSGMDVIMPLWFTQEMGGTAAEWAHLRSLRWAGVLVGVIVLGALSDRFGQRLFGALSMFGAAAVAGALGIGLGRALFIAMPLFGCFVSNAFINMNTLTQQVSDRRQGLANSIYRSVGAACGVVAPVAATALAGRWGSYGPVYLLLAGLLVVGGLILFSHPGEARSAPFRGLRAEIKQWASVYRTAIREKGLMRFIHLSQIWGNVLAGVGTFLAIRYTQELGQSDQRFGLFCSVAGAEALAMNVALGAFLDRASLRHLHVGVAMVTSLCAILMGCTDSPLWTTVGFLISAPMAGALAGPSSMWVSRAAGAASQTAAFSVHKVLSSFYMFGSMIILGWLEPRIGIRSIFLWGGIFGLIVGVAFLGLPEPPPKGS